MKRALLIGNGFTSQLIPAYKSASLMQRLREELPEEYSKIELFFSKFRITYSGDLFLVDYHYPWGEPEDIAEFCLPTAYKEVKSEYIRKHICNVLSEYGFPNPEAMCDKYFFDAGLGYEISSPNLVGIESPLKILDLAKHIHYFPSSWHRVFKETIMKILYNNGHFHFSDCNSLISRKKAKKYFDSFSTVFTTNYDLILDDLVSDKIKHLHGGFNFQTPFQQHYRDITPSNYYIVLGANGVEKYRALFGYKPINKPSLLESYFTSLGTEDFDELHIFGYSGENDNHINNAILGNYRIKKVIYYCSPHKINDSDLEFHYASQFITDPHDSYRRFSLKSWDSLWDQIK